MSVAPDAATARPAQARRGVQAVAAAVAVLAVASIVGILVLGLLPESAPRLPSSPLSPGSMFLSLGFVTLALLVVRQQPGNRISWWFLVVGSGIAFSMFLITLGAVLFERDQPGWQAALVLGTAFGELVWPLLWVSAQVFPDGRPAPGRFWKAVLGLSLTTVVLGMLRVVLTSGPVRDFNDAPITANPASLPTIAGWDWQTVVEPLAGWSIRLSMVAGAASLIFRWWRADAAQRRQLLAFTLGMPAVLLFALSTAVIDYGRASTLISSVFLLLLPVSFGVSILRYRLYELDSLISRGAAWTVLTGVLVAVYVAVVSFVTWALPVRPSTVQISLATLTCAAAFAPLRRRVQRSVDRRFNRARWDAQRQVDAFGVRLRGDLTPQEVADTMLGAVDRIAEPSGAAVWLRPPARTGPQPP